MKLTKNEKASFSGSNDVDFCLRKIYFEDKHIRKIKQPILHETRHIMMSTIEKSSELYEYPGGNQVDGLRPVSSFFPGTMVSGSLHFEAEVF